MRHLRLGIELFGMEFTIRDFSHLRKQAGNDLYTRAAAFSTEELSEVDYVP
jgi:hypothetical protein